MEKNETGGFAIAPTNPNIREQSRTHSTDTGLIEGNAVFKERVFQNRGEETDNSVSGDETTNYLLSNDYPIKFLRP